jgi:hypothetical protein
VLIQLLIKPKIKMATEAKTEELQKIFNELDKDSDGLLTLEEAKQMMETLGELDTQVSLEELLQDIGLDSEVEDLKINFDDFLIIYNRSQGARNEPECGLEEIVEEMLEGSSANDAETTAEDSATGSEETQEKIEEVAVHEVGVGGAKEFFEEKIEKQKGPSKEDEMKKVQDEARRKKFQQKLAFFSNSQQS